MIDRYRAPKLAVAVTALALLGGTSLAGCTDRANESKQATTSSPFPDASRKGGPQYPWPYCDNAPEHRARAVGESKDGLIVLVDSHCTDPSDPYTGVYDSLGDASQATGNPRGRIRNGSKVVVLCRREGQTIYNDKHVASADWDLVTPLPDQDMILPNGNQVLTTGSEMVLIPNTHLAFFDDQAIGACAMK